VVFLDFWATWCGPCRMEMPHIQALHDEMKDSGEVVFIGASNEDQKTIETWLQKNPYTFKMVMVKPEDAQTKYKVTSIPAGFVIDREGMIRAHMIGAQSEMQLRTALGKAGIK
jgi:thiol-disulfide isomerase/thioredoxin